MCSSENHIRFFVIYRPPSYNHTANNYIHHVIDCLATYKNSSYTNINVGDIFSTITISLVFPERNN